MPTLPVIQDSAQLQVGVGRQRVQASPNAFGAQEARGAQAVAQGLGAVAQVAEEKDDEFDTANALELDNELSRRIRDRMFNPEDGYFSSERGRGRNAMDNRAAVEAEIDAIAVELSTGARSDRARARFSEAARRRVGSTLGDIAEHAARQNIAYQNEVDAAALAEARDNIIAAFDDPVRLAANLATADGVIQRTAERNGLGPELTQRAIDEYRSDIYARVIVQLAATDPERAEEMFMLHAPDMTAQDRAELGSQMRAARRLAEENTIDEAWTYVARGERVPGELWARVPGRAQIDIQNEIRRRAENGARTGDRTLIEDLRVMAVADPRRFAQADLRAVRSALGSSYDDLAIAQARIRAGDEAVDVVQQRSSFNALQGIAEETLGLDLSPPERASGADQRRAAAFNAALLREVQGFQAAANPGVGIDTETAQTMIGRAWVSMRGADVGRRGGGVRGDLGVVRGDTGRERGAVAPGTEVNVPYRAIPPDVARRIGARLRQRLGRTATQGEVENAYSQFLRGQALQIGGE